MLTVKTLFLALLQHSQVYIMDSEPNLKRRYADLIMLIRPDMRHFSIFDLLIEFKHVKLSEIRNAGAQISGEELRRMQMEDLLAMDPVKDKLAEAQDQLKVYREVLVDKYKGNLKLRAFTVIGVGLDRLVWQEYAP